MTDIEKYDEKTYWRCPPLGGPVQFVHCRKVNGGLPCNRIAGCWSAKMDLPAFLKENYTPEELELALGSPGKGRLETIFETLEKTRGRGDK